MKKQLLTLAVACAAPLANAGTVTSAGDDLVIDTKGGFEVYTADKSKSFKLGGRIMWDYDSTDSDDDSKDSDDMEVRRARIYASGNVNDWEYKAQFNINNASNDYEDLYIRYNGFGKKASITVGNHHEPFGLDQLTSSNDMPLLERAAVTESYTPGRSEGISLSGKDSNWTYGIGVYEADGDAENTALTGRLTYVPFQNDNSLVHLGVGFSSRDAEMSDDEVDVIGLEAAYVVGAFHAQAEYFDAEFGDQDEDGYYVQVGYVLTGEMRPYKDGKFKRVKASGDSGAWEIVLRYEDGFAKYSDIGLSTAEGSQTSFGVNYYLNDNVRMGASYMTGENDASGLDGNELRLRLQFTY